MSETSKYAQLGIDVVGGDDPRLKQILQEVSERTHVKLYKLGECETSEDPNNHVIIETDYDSFSY